MIWATAVSLVNARVVVPDGMADSVRFSARVLALGDRPRRGDTVVDLAGAFVVPGLVNAHDHLELNHYGRLKCRDGEYRGGAMGEAPTDSWNLRPRRALREVKTRGPAC